MTRDRSPHALVRMFAILFAITWSVTTFARPAKAPPPAPPAASSSASPSDAPPDDATPEEPPLPWKDGPQTIDLGHGATMALPAGRRFLGMPDAAKVMEKLGNLSNEDLVGIAISADEDAPYLVSVRYEDSGYVKDDEKVDAKEILDSIKSGEDEYNAERKKRGFSPIHADGWSEEPRYDRAAHSLVWALLVSSGEGKSVNLNTRVLGRNGFVAVNLIAAPEDLPKYRADGLAFVQATTFKAGSRYEDFNSSTDKVAEYGLAGLILGGVGIGVAKAAKVGLLAAFWKPIVAFLVAAKKAVLVGIAALVGFVKRLLGKRGKPQQPVA
jgi:uncharacterized membrane-anchored protein